MTYAHTETGRLKMKYVFESATEENCFKLVFAFSVDEAVRKIEAGDFIKLNYDPTKKKAP